MLLLDTIRYFNFFTNELILLKGRESFQTRSSRNRLETVLNVGAALADNVTVGLAGLHSSNSEDAGWLGLDEIEKLFSAEKIDLSFELLVRRLRAFLAQTDRPSHKGDELILEGLKQVTENRQPANLFTEFFNLLGEAMRRGCLSLRCEHEVIQELFHPRRMMDFSENRAFGTPQILRLMREFGGERMVERFGEKFFERAMHPKEMMRMIEMRPEVALKWLRLMREFGNRRWVENLPDFFQHKVHHMQAAAIFVKNQEAALSMIRVLHLCDDKRFAQHLENVYQKVPFFPTPRWRFDVTKVPLDYIGDLQWYARTTENSDLLRDIDHNISWRSNEI